MNPLLLVLLLSFLLLYIIFLLLCRFILQGEQRIIHNRQTRQFLSNRYIMIYQYVQKYI